MTEFDRALLERLAAQFLARAKREAKSKTIANSLTARVVGAGKIVIESPYYWAVYYHDGRGPIRARPGHKLVYFRNPDNDPRIGGSARRYPVRRSDVRRLSRSQFYRYLKDPASGMVVTRRVGPSKGDPFLKRAARTFPTEAGNIGSRLTSAEVRRELRDVLSLKLNSRFTI